MKTHLKKAYPELSDLLDQIEDVPVLQVRSGTVLDAVCSLVIQQMLSIKAAKSITERASNLVCEKGYESIAQLGEDDLRSCGLSGRKVKTIKQFYEYYAENTTEVENWRNLRTEQIFIEVNKMWGLSDWTASIMAIFYFGKEDVFPHKDSTIQKALRLLAEQNIHVEPELAKPYRSYLAMYLWRILDGDYL